jgi:murein DD-endopeptidase MepM/ murein hydrolase activator NlpD
MQHGSVRPAVGTYVRQGDPVALAGSTGCSSQPNLEFRVYRLTNLSGGRSYAFQATPDGPYGVNGEQGVIDPFGWNAPKGNDPYAYRFLSTAGPQNMATVDPNGVALPPGIHDVGAFSLNLWLPGAAPPTIGSPIP